VALHKLDVSHDVISVVRKPGKRQSPSLVSVRGLDNDER
jgi:hypothetical protein